MAKALIAIWGDAKTSPRSTGNNYVGIVELSQYGYIRTELHFPYGVKVPPHIPYMVLVDCNDTVAEIRDGKYPLITVNKWDEFEELYSNNI